MFHRSLRCSTYYHVLFLTAFVVKKIFSQFFISLWILMLSFHCHLWTGCQKPRTAILGCGEFQNDVRKDQSSNKHYCAYLPCRQLKQVRQTGLWGGKTGVNFLREQGDVWKIVGLESLQRKTERNWQRKQWNEQHNKRINKATKE